MQQLRGLEEKPVAATDPLFDLEKEQLISMIHFVYKLKDEEAEKNKAIMQRLDAIQEKLDLADSRHEADAKYATKLLAEISRLNKRMEELMDERRRSDRTIADLQSQLEVYKKNKFKGTSQKGRKARCAEDKNDKENDRHDFDGTASSKSKNAEEPVKEKEAETGHSDGYILHRTGLKYKTMNATRSVFHVSDRSKLPKGAVIIKCSTQSFYEEISQVIEHQFEMITYKLPNGKIEKAYFPMEGDTTAKANFPGTHASCRLLAGLAFDKYCISTPLHREVIRLMSKNMQVSRNTLQNWISKGGSHLRKALRYLKEQLLQKGAVVNCDETWYRVKVNRKYGKKYIWCMVNREAKVCVFFYDDGSRGREVLREFIGDTKIAALQSDGYNAYMYLDDKLVNIEHLCCMAHARAKFKYAQEQGSDTRADYFIEMIGRLYDMERDYKRKGLKPDDIRKERQSLETIQIMADLEERLHRTMMEMENEGESQNSLLYKALNYLNTYWKQLFAYRNDGRYTIDNSLAERSIRPITVERKQSMFYGSHKGAGLSVVYHTFVETCRLAGVSVLDYFTLFFTAVMNGREDYQNLLPNTIGIKK